MSLVTFYVTWHPLAARSSTHNNQTWKDHVQGGPSSVKREKKKEKEEKRRDLRLTEKEYLEVAKRRPWPISEYSRFRSHI